MSGWKCGKRCVDGASAREGLCLSGFGTRSVIVRRNVGFRCAPIKWLRPVAIPSVFFDMSGIQIGEPNIANQRESNRCGEQEDLFQATQWTEYRNNRRNSGYAFEDHYKNPLCYSTRF
jgi:hypothetical protein